MVTVSAIVAYAANRAIGKDGQIPWDISAERRLFRACTMGKVVVMGRATWESIPPEYRPLPGRLNIVLSTKHRQLGDAGDCLVVPSIQHALLLAEGLADYDEVVFIGGQRVYEEGLPYCDRLYLTEIEGIYPGDRFFPKFDTNEWATMKSKYIPIEETGVAAYTFKILEKVR